MRLFQGPRLLVPLSVFISTSKGKEIQKAPGREIMAFQQSVQTLVFIVVAKVSAKEGRKDCSPHPKTFED